MPTVANFAVEPRLVLKGIGSLRLTLLALVGLVAGATWVYGLPDEAEAFDWPLIVPLAVLSVNLLAAIAINRAFRQQLSLLVFHLALLALVLLGLASRLTYFSGRAEVTTGSNFDGFIFRQAGLWHRGAIDRVEFTNLGFEINYLPGLKRDRTINRARYRDEAGFQHTVEFGDHMPLVLHGYRFYTTSNKGFSALFRWEPISGEPQIGSINFPGYPLHADKQSTTWRLGAQDIQLTLDIPDPLIDPSKDSGFRSPTRDTLTIDLGWRVARLAPGETVQIPSGHLVYLGLTTWMGYKVFYDWTMPWLLAACVLAVLALGWHVLAEVRGQALAG